MKSIIDANAKFYLLQQFSPLIKTVKYDGVYYAANKTI